MCLVVDDNEQYQVKVQGVDISPYPIARGEPVTFSLASNTGALSFFFFISCSDNKACTFNTHITHRSLLDSFEVLFYSNLYICYQMLQLFGFLEWFCIVLVHASKGFLYLFIWFASYICRQRDFKGKAGDRSFILWMAYSFWDTWPLWWDQLSRRNWRLLGSTLASYARLYSSGKYVTLKPLWISYSDTFIH